MVEVWDDEHLEMLKETGFINASFGCSYLCDFCGVNAPPQISITPWPWLEEIRENANRLGEKNFILTWLSDPLRDYSDPVFRKHAGHAFVLFPPKGDIRTRGVFRDSPGEQAALYVREHFPDINFHVSIDIANRLFRRMGKEGFIDYLKHSVELFQPHVSFNQNGTTKLGEQNIFLEVWEAVTGEKLPFAVGASYAGRFLQFDASQYENMEPWKDEGRCYLGSSKMIMPNGDFAEGPLNFAATEYKCIWNRPSTEPLVNYVAERSPIPDYTENEGFRFSHFNKVHFLYSRPNEWCDQPFWEEFLNEFMEGSRSPTLEGLTSEMRDYALRLSGMGIRELNNEYDGMNKTIFNDSAPNLLFVSAEMRFGKFMKEVYDMSKEPRANDELFERFFLVMREYIYREWDVGLKPRSYSSPS
jgi:hypothetical protein|tara:strand:+ start:647 stop:1891 length:1245 start_codon:yes stop_codon:yes gene_type:complete